MKTLVLLFFSFASLAQCATIFTQPLAQITCEGDSIRLFCLSSGGSYQWEKRRPSDPKFTSITGARSSRFAFLSGGATHPSGSYYRLKISVGKCVNYSDSVLIILRKAPIISALTVCENTNVPLSSACSWTINGLPVDSVIATPSLQGAKLKAFSRFSTLPFGSCVLASNEVTLSVTSLPAAPVHAVKLVKACLGLPFSLNATGCSPSLTFWFDISGRKVGEGSRLLVTRSDSSIFRASCVKSGCEGPLSLGVKIAPIPIPEAPENMSPSYFCSGVPISLQASGGVNNVWYETATAKSNLSTASALAMKAITANGANDSLLTRFVSVKINDCESSRTLVPIRIKTQLQLEPLEAFSLTGDRTIPIPETNVTQASLPIRVSYSSSANSPLGPFTSPGLLIRTVIDSLGCSTKDTALVHYTRNGPIIHHLIALKTTNCSTHTYLIKIQGCPLKTSAIGSTKRYESPSAEFILTGGLYRFICNDGETDTISLNLPLLKQPSSSLRKSFTGPICAADSAFLTLSIDSSVRFIGWELNGHLFSTDKTVKGILPAGEYGGVMEDNGCFYRAEKILLERKSNPPTPTLEKTGAYFVRVQSEGIPEWLIDQTRSTDSSYFQKLSKGREFYARAKWRHKSLSCYSPYSNVYYVDTPPTYEFTVYPNPTKGLFSIEIAYETDDALLQLVDLKGQLLYSKQIKNSSRKMDFDISPFSAGTYVIRLISDGISQEKTIRKFP
ncbi:T9SS type A sorting domain-containing protein [Aquirufa novilacunae]|jgi:hypothetical protein|uniref:T9SS type A sorting domain-containing protein n=1 Tax=Aquirufa novilacunae TaxID=3139305 RepID=A0ABW8TXA1_9BACT